jgi:hypothetical protein
MSGGRACTCEERKEPMKSRRWRVLQRHCNHSAFNGYHYTPSYWSSLMCARCHTVWRTKASYVHDLADATPQERGISP